MNDPRVDLIEEIHNLLTYFDEEELLAFCQKYYPTLYENITAGMSRGRRIRLLLDHCERKTSLQKLRKQLQDEQGETQYFESVKKTTITVQIQFEQFTGQIKDDFFTQLSTIAGLDGIEDYVVSIKKGSVIIVLILPKSISERLLYLHEFTSITIGGHLKSKVLTPKKAYVPAMQTTAQDGQPSAFVIEDDEALGDIFGTALKKVGFSVEVILDGEIALNRLLSYQPDLLVLDMQLPYVSGADILKALSKQPKRPKIIVATAMLHVPEEVWELADVVLHKPLRFDNLQRVARKLLDSEREFRGD